jgi:hypothetical protein
MTPEELAQELASAALVYELNPNLRGEADDVYDFLADALLDFLDGHAVIDGQLRKLVERVLHTNIREVSNAEDMWTEWDDVTAYVLDSEVSR